MLALSAVALAAARRLRADRSVIVGGHGVASVDCDLDPHNLCVAPERFRAQLELLLGAGFRFVTVARLAQLAAGGVPPPGLAALSFDDGMENNVSVLLPLLREYGVPATVYVTTGLMGMPNPWVDPRAGMRMMTRDELLELSGAGIEIGAHSVTHPDLSLLGIEACRREVQGSREALREVIGEDVETFAYPLSSPGPAAMQAVREAGFAVAVTGDGRRSWAPLATSRAMITGVDGIPAFLAKLAGVYGPVFRAPAVARARTLTRRPRLHARRLRARRRRVPAG